MPTRTPRGQQSLDRLKGVMERNYSRLQAHKIAYFTGNIIDGRKPEYQDLKKAARVFIRSNYDYQKAVLGKIHVKLSVADLLRE